MNPNGRVIATPDGRSMRIIEAGQPDVMPILPVLLLHGDEDRIVPIAHGKWLADRIPGVDARLLSGDGHMTLAVRRIPDVHAWLSSRM